MTSFGKGNDAILEKKIVDITHENINTKEPAYNLTGISHINYSVEGHRGQTVCAVADNPLHHEDSFSVPSDMLCLKSTLEKKFFGKCFNDNVHIQLIYNILDIEKILAAYSTNAVYALNNMNAVENDEREDLFEYLTTDLNYDSFISQKSDKVTLFEKFVQNPRLAYFADAFFDTSNKRRTALRPQKELYSMLALIAKLRHWCVHSEEGDAEYWLYKLDNLSCEFIDILDTLYNRSVYEINYKFVDTNKVNIQILQSICKNIDQIALIKSYYEFLITKKHKNLGFSIRKLREEMLIGTTYTSNPSDKLYNKNLNSVRNKLFQMTDFIIYLGYINEDCNRANGLVNNLRSSILDENKESIYKEEAAFLWNKHKDSIDKIVKSLDGDNIKKLGCSKLDIPNDKLENCFIKPAKIVSSFTKLIYLLTRFLNGKEINDLLTTLINKFDNIRSFIETMDALELEKSFTKDYVFFENSQKYLDELIELNSFAKSCSFDINAKKIMYRDAIDILGVKSDKTDAEIDNMIDQILQVDTNGNKKLKKNNGLRNFIASNVIDSNRFKYLIRYGNPKKIREIANCVPAVKFVLKDIPDAQIERYYDSYFLDDAAICSVEKKRNALAEVISNMSFELFADAGKYQKANVETRTYKAEIKRKNQAIIRLYLTVMYLMLKNLVNVNSRYVIGFHCVERDAKLYALSGLGIGNIKNDFSYVTEAVLGITNEDKDPSGRIISEPDATRAGIAANKHLRNKRWYRLIFDNLKKSDKKIVTRFRNTVCHLNAIRNMNSYIGDIGYIDNYFALYHYIIQKALSKVKTNNTYTNEYISNLNEYHTYSKDFVKTYCIPFGYSLVRYKNLTIDGQFDKNNPQSSQ